MAPKCGQAWQSAAIQMETVRKLMDYERLVMVCIETFTFWGRLEPIQKDLVHKSPLSISTDGDGLSCLGILLCDLVIICDHAA